MSNKTKRILKHLSPIKGEGVKNLNFKLPKNLWMKLNIKANQSDKYVNQYMIDLIIKDTDGIEVKVK